ncbi:unnamed protein product [Ambrosiozyma monospora]|uniref:Unnamed protein product n=1 Tax=Ambrosiozyma monospora TaxID=43982 RepID=A0A9W6Z1X4_AMBMO|nr:unnamed protein product [Ambrosiozyma monospora]
MKAKKQSRTPDSQDVTLQQHTIETSSCNSDTDIEKQGLEGLQLQKRLLTPFLIDKKVPPIPLESERAKYQYRETNFLSQLFFLWCLPILNVGYRRTIEPEDLYRIDSESQFDSNNQANTFYKHFENQKRKNELSYLKKHHIEDTPESRASLKNDPNFKYSEWLVFFAVYHTLAKEVWDVIISKSIGDIAADLNPLLIKAFITYIHEKATGKTTSISMVLLSSVVK